MSAAAHILVSGVVQGVGYRYFAHRTAREMRLVGFARNRYDGDVEVQVEGDRGLIEDFIETLRIGPPSSHVTEMKVEWLKPRGEFEDFQIRF